jgi:hypothetical protein
MSGFFIQSRFGNQGNFEVVLPERRAGGLVHYWRNNDEPTFPWSGPSPFGTGLGEVDGVSLIESNYGSPGNLEIVAVAGGQLVHFWRDSVWNGPITIAGSVAGGPGFIQSRFGTQGNFEVVVPTVSGGLTHYFRNNDDSNLPWIQSTSFGEAIGAVNAVSLIQSNFGDPGNLEVVASASGQLFYFWRDSGPSFSWNGPFALPVNGLLPSLIQSRFGAKGNFELVVQMASGGLAHYSRNNDDPNSPWSLPVTFGAPTPFGIPSLLQSNFGSPGNLEVVAGTGDPIAGFDLLHFWRDSGPAFIWNGPDVAEKGV